MRYAGEFMRYNVTRSSNRYVIGLIEEWNIQKMINLETFIKIEALFIYICKLLTLQNWSVVSLSNEITLFKIKVRIERLILVFNVNNTLLKSSKIFM